MDYADYVTIDSSDAEEAYKNASSFIEKIKEVINALIQQLNDSFFSNRLDYHGYSYFTKKPGEKTCQGDQKIEV